MYDIVIFVDIAERSVCISWKEQQTQLVEVAFLILFFFGDVKGSQRPGWIFNEACSVHAHVEQVLLANLVLVVAQSRPQQGY